MAIEFHVMLEDRPGALARLGRTLGDANVNIDAIHGTKVEGGAAVRFVTDHPPRAADALDKAGFRFETREVLCVHVLDEPGTLGDVALVMAEAGIDIDSVYVSTKGHVIFGVDDLAGAMQVAGGMAVMAHRSME